jgi:hypothetical protein
MAERWNGKKWAVQRTAGGYLIGISCVSTLACTAVGGLYGPPYKLTLAQRWNGKRWAIQPTASTIVDSYLHGVSCVPGNRCVATGVSGFTADGQSLAEHWNGAGWTMHPTPYVGYALSDVSCTSAKACTAVAFPAQDIWRTAAERWDGTRWTVHSTIQPGENKLNSWLTGVSCTSATACTAVGFYSREWGDPGCPGFACVALAESWNGSSWKILPAPDTGDTQFVDVWCSSATACTAVGSQGGKALAERWDGKNWTAQPTPNPPAARSSDLTGISCTSAAACTAIGQYGTAAGANQLLVERWDGTIWAIQSAPTPAGAQSSSLASISCASATSCTAVGTTHYSAGRTLALGEHWNGTTWSIQPSRNPGGSNGSVLSRVSCGLGAGCTAVGYYNNGYDDVTLVERSRS